MRVLFVSTHNVPCGIADYNIAMMKVAEKYCDVDVEVLPQDDSVSKEDIKRIVGRAKTYDAVIVQHEWGFFEQNLLQHYGRLRFFLRCFRKKNIPTALIMHTRFGDLRGGRRSLVFWAEKFLRLPLVKEINKSTKLKIFVHGKVHVRNLILQGIRSERIIRIAYPHQPQGVIPQVRSIAKSDDVSLVMFGFISSYKGYETALNAMRILPENFKLTIAGGQHPNGMNDLTYENILGFIETGKWFRYAQINMPFKTFNEKEAKDFKNRITLTGHLSDDEISEEIKKADIILAPYFAENPPIGSAAVEKSISLGKPLVSSTAYTFSNYIQAGCAMPVTPAAPYHLAKAVLELSSSPEEMKQLSEKALQYSKSNSVDEITKKILFSIVGKETVSLAIKSRDATE